MGEYEEGCTISYRTKWLLQQFKGSNPQDLLEYRYDRLRSDNFPLYEDYAVVETIYCGLFVEQAEMLSCSEKWYNKYIHDLTQVLHKSYEIKRDKLDPAKVTPILPVFKSTEKVIAEEKPQSLLFSNLFEEFMSYKISKANLSERSQNEYRANFPVFLCFIGDIPVEEITTKKIRDCLHSSLKLPRRNLKPYKTKSIAELVAMDVPQKDRLSSKTVDSFRKLLQGIFAFAKEQEYIRQSPAVNLNLNFKIARTKAAFRNAEVVKLLTAALVLTGKYECHKWVILLGAYSGARLGEIIQLRVIDFKVDPDSQIKYLRITNEAGSVKTDNSNRIVPVHSKLLDLGFEAFVMARDGGRLFPGSFRSKTITGWFPRLMRNLAIPKQNDFDQSRTFHSLRHSFVTEARGNGQSTDLVQAVVGHERTSAGQTDIYTGHFTVDKLKPVVESIIYL